MNRKQDKDRSKERMSGRKEMNEMSNEHEDRKTKSKFILRDIFVLIIFMVLVVGVVFPVYGYGYSNPIDYYKDAIGQATSEKLSGTVYLKNIPIHLDGDTGFTQYDLDKLTGKVPDVLLQYCSEIYICNFDDPNSVCYQFTNEDHAKDGGFTIWDNSGRIFINSKSYNKLNTIIHELMHRYDEVYGVISKNEQVIDLYNQYANQISSYATTDSGEFLAESAVQYFLEPEKLQRNAQPVYDYFQSLFQYYA